MKKYIYASLFVAVALLAGCSKSEPEPEPAEQVIGSYTVEKYTESIKYATSPSEYSETTTYPVKGQSNGLSYEITAVLDVAKTSSNIVNVTFAQTAKFSNGQTQKEFEMLDTGVKIGTIGNKAITIEDVVNDKDSLGRAYTYTIRLTGKKAI
jgi:PBP1b-binding outer membrane lipoprotein LpoB